MLINKQLGKFAIIVIIFSGLNTSLCAQEKKWDQHKVDVKESKILWKAKQGEKWHQGTAPVLNGFTFLEKDQLKGGTLFIDMNNITITSLDDNGDYIQMMEFMQGPDFFDVRKNPFAVCKIYNVSQTTSNEYTHMLGASLTIKGYTHKFEVPVNVVITKESVLVTANLSFDRNHWNLEGYKKGSVKEEEIIQDLFEIEFSIKSNRTNKS